jgi:hypothetical protein
MAAQKKYPDELRERAVRMLFEVREREGSRLTRSRRRTVMPRTGLVCGLLC